MAFTDTQLKSLRSKLDPKRIKTRASDGAALSYVEGWHVIGEANRIFGFDAWDRRTVSTNCVWTGVKSGAHHASYLAKVRVTVRAGDTIIVREGSGSCEASANTIGQAHEFAVKGAETDATKRALATFGNPFGLALYDPEHAGVKKTRRDATGGSGPWPLRAAHGAHLTTYLSSNDFIAALRQSMSEAQDIESLYDVWEQNINTVRAIHRNSRENSDVVPELVRHLRACAIALVKRASDGNNGARKVKGASGKIDKSVLAIGEPKRHRSKDHLRFVATQPCVICGRAPSHAHHVRFAQSRGLSLKVSDEFTVPLCAIHHHELHTVGKEEEWWKTRNIDPLKIASDLWQESNDSRRHRSQGSAFTSEDPEGNTSHVAEENLGGPS
jgi:DNA recombination protein Rad52